MSTTFTVLKFNAWLKLLALPNIPLQGVGREREEREGEEKRRTTCAHARLICVGRGSAGVHQPSCTISSRWALIDGAVSAAVAEVQESCEWWEWRWSRWCCTT